MQCKNSSTEVNHMLHFGSSQEEQPSRVETQWWVKAFATQESNFTNTSKNKHIFDGQEAELLW